MIVFGTNSYLLKTVSPMDMNFQSGVQSNLKIEYRQRYFHLFWIPFFPIGRVWSVRQAGTLYHVSDELKQTLEEVRPGWKRAIWAWTGPLLIVAGILIFNISQNLEEKAWRDRSEKSKTILSAFFKDKNNTEHLRNKLESMTSLIDTSLTKVKYDRDAIDTTTNKLLNLYFETSITHLDTLTGYNEQNTYVVTDFSNISEENQITKTDIKESLSAGDWKGYDDTSSIFQEIRKLEKYKYVLVLKEYCRVKPIQQDKSFQSGYSLTAGSLYSIDDKKLLKEFRQLVGNSDSVSNYSFSRSSTASDMDRALSSDLNKNVMKETKKYVFGKEAKL